MWQVVVLPVLSGAWLNQQFPRAVKRAAPFAPLVAVVMVALICASIVAQNAAAVKTAGLQLLAAICALHLGRGAYSLPSSSQLSSCQQQPAH